MKILRGILNFDVTTRITLILVDELLRVIFLINCDQYGSMNQTPFWEKEKKLEFPNYQKHKNINLKT